VGADSNLLIPLNAPGRYDEGIVGGKAATLARLAEAGFNVPQGFCLTTRAYEAFVGEAKITAAIDMELDRKSMDGMRWEEIWDAALRIRSLFLTHPLSDHLRETIAGGLSEFDPSTPLAVRSSALGEDSAGRSFAGLHESITGVRGNRAVEDAVRVVWSSLWSDAALLYRKELGLDPAHSRMAVIVQEMVDGDRSGVAFARDPRDASKNLAILESVPGPCSQLVDGLVDPDRWEIDRETGRIIAWYPGKRDDSEREDVPLLEPSDLENILSTLLQVEQLFRWPPDLEWTGRSESFTVLQARPITTSTSDEDKERSWYLTLRPNDTRLQELRKRVAGQLIPELEAEGRRLAAEDIDRLDDRQLAAAIEHRSEVVAKWKKIYWDEFIPFAHGVRRLATYYNDAVQPADPYEFVALLRNQPMLATERNRCLAKLAGQLASNESLRAIVTKLVARHAGSLSWPSFRDDLTEATHDSAEFVQSFEELSDRFLDIAYDQARLHDQPEPLLRNIIELSHRSRHAAGESDTLEDAASVLEQRLLEAVGPQNHREALELIETGRVSWRLRDDDNLLVARLESQLLRALDAAAQRLRKGGRLSGEGRPNAAHAETIVRALCDESACPVKIEPNVEESEPTVTASGETPRQLIGQPASPGIATGLVRCVRGHEDLGKFREGEILVCDAIQPTMTHLVPLAGAIIERRGGMLIHGAIIARELGIPCVNGVRNAAEVLHDGDLVSVDGVLGIVTVGAPEFDLELKTE
jgi:phosphohistidine swiveling domain-containing protein